MAHIVRLLLQIFLHRTREEHARVRKETLDLNGNFHMPIQKGDPLRMDIDRIQKAQYASQYMTGMRPIIEKRALFSDTTSEYVTPAEPSAYDLITIRFRTALNNIDRVFFISKNEKFLMNRISSDENFDYYALEIQLEDQKLSYCFLVVTGKVSCYYDLRGPVREMNEYYNFVVIPGFHTPAWAKGAVMYQIFVDRFCNGDTTNDVVDREYSYLREPVAAVQDWYKAPSQFGVREFYGGDLLGVLSKLDYLADLGVEVLYFNPLFVSPSNHKYDIQDYDYIDPHFGKIVSEDGANPSSDDSAGSNHFINQEPSTQPNQFTNDNRFATIYRERVTNPKNLQAGNDLFIRLVEEAHKRGMRVILDGVFNHCGSYNKWMDRERIYEGVAGYAPGAYQSAQSPYRSYFSFRREYDWPYNSSYDGWWGHDTLPKLNYEASHELLQYMLDIARKWVSPPYNADGWRLDVAADLGYSPSYNHYFWQEFRKAVKEANPNAIILAEHYGTSKDWLQGNEWDTIMNYDAFMEPVTWFLTGMEKHSDDFREDLLGNAQSFWNSMHHHSASFSMPSLQVAMNQLSNHDHSRFLTRTNHLVGRTNTLGWEAAGRDVKPAVFREAIVIQMTWVGAPTIYYGDEAGLVGFTDPDNRRTYPWGREDQDLIAFHKAIIKIRKDHPQLRTGSLKRVGDDFNILAYGRFDQNGQCLVVINNNEEPRYQELSVWELNIPKEATMVSELRSDEHGFSLEKRAYEVSMGRVKITMPPLSAAIFTLQRTP